jgi:hypothetical protein
VSDWTTFGLRDAPPLSGRTRIENLSPVMASMVGEANAALAHPVTGITDDGSVRPGLYPLGPTEVSTASITEAAQHLLSVVDAEHRERLVYPLDADEKRLWFNVHPNVMRHGLLLEDLPSSVDEPWAWQIDGHHLNLNCLVLDGQLAFTPSFMRVSGRYSWGSSRRRPNRSMSWRWPRSGPPPPRPPRWRRAWPTPPSDRPGAPPSASITPSSAWCGSCWWPRPTCS